MFLEESCEDRRSEDWQRSTTKRKIDDTDAAIPTKVAKISPNTSDANLGMALPHT